MKLRLDCLVFMLFLLLTACSNTDLDSGLFSGKPCKAPCWQNLTPSQSTADDVDQFINRLSTASWPGRKSIVETPNCKLMQITDKIGAAANAIATFNIENGILSFIQSTPANSTDLEEIIDHLGPPEYFEAVIAIGPDGKNYIVEVYYPSQGLAFIVDPSIADVGYIKPYMNVLTIQYFAPGSLLSYFTVRKSCFMSQADAAMRAQSEISIYVQPWSGFGAVKVVTSR